MGACFSGLDRVEPASPLKVDRNTPEGGQTPFCTTRTCTDVFFIILLLIFLLPLAGLIIYCVRYGDIYRILNGYDRCGNVCGRVTERLYVLPLDQRFSCLGADMTKRKFLLVKGAGTSAIVTSNVDRECVLACNSQPGYRQFINRCIPEKTEEQVNSFFSKTGLSNFFQEVSEDLDLCWREILALCFIALGFSVLLLLLLRFAVGLVVWVMLGAVLVVSVVATAYLWVQWSSVKDSQEMALFEPSDTEEIVRDSYLGYAIVATVITIVVFLLVLVMRSRIQLVVQIFEEAGRAIASMPLLLACPWVTFVVLGLLVSLWLYLSLWIESSGHITSENNNNIYYKKNDAMKIARWYNLLALFWLAEFAIAFQHMVIAGAVATWYFSRKKSSVESPIADSALRVVNYHLGSLAIGSLLVSIAQLARVLLKAIQTQLRSGTPGESFARDMLVRGCSCCLWVFEKIIAFLSRNAYIETAIRGCNFYEGGKRAFTLLGSNSLRVAAINSVGDFVLLMGKVSVVLITLLIGTTLIQQKEGVQHVWVPITLAAVFAYLVAHTFMTVYEMVIDTIFLCFCEDCEINDGVSRPYFMSRGLMNEPSKEQRVASELAQLKSRASVYHDHGMNVLVKEGLRWAVLVVTPLMARAHNLEQSSHVTYVDTTARLGAWPYVVTSFLTNTEAGVLPLAVFMHRSMTADSYKSAFHLLRKYFPRSFGGNQEPEMFVSEDLVPLKKGLHDIWPSAGNRLFTPEAAQAEWRWLHAAENFIPREKRRHLMKCFQNVMEVDSQESLETALADIRSQPFPKFVQRFEKNYARSEEWVQLHLPRQTGNAETKAAEASVRVYRAAIQSKAGGLRVGAMVNFTCTTLESHTIARLLDLAYGKETSPAYVALCPQLSDQEVGRISKDGDLITIENFLEGKRHEVIPSLGVCSCPPGRRGSFCRHQAYLSSKVNASWMNSTSLTPQQRRELSRLALGERSPPTALFIGSQLFNNNNNNGKAGSRNFSSSTPSGGDFAVPNNANVHPGVPSSENVPDKESSVDTINQDFSLVQAGDRQTDSKLRQIFNIPNLVAKFGFTPRASQNNSLQAPDSHLDEIINSTPLQVFNVAQSGGSFPEAHGFLGNELVISEQLNSQKPDSPEQTPTVSKIPEQNNNVPQVLPENAPITPEGQLLEHLEYTIAPIQEKSHERNINFENLPNISENSFTQNINDNIPVNILSNILENNDNMLQIATHQGDDVINSDSPSQLLNSAPVVVDTAKIAEKDLGTSQKQHKIISNPNPSDRDTSAQGAQKQVNSPVLPKVMVITPTVIGQQSDLIPPSTSDSLSSLSDDTNTSRQPKLLEMSQGSLSSTFQKQINFYLPNDTTFSESELEENKSKSPPVKSQNSVSPVKPQNSVSPPLSHEIGVNNITLNAEIIESNGVLRNNKSSDSNISDDLLISSDTSLKDLKSQLVIISTDQKSFSPESKVRTPHNNVNKINSSTDASNHLIILPSSEITVPSVSSVNPVQNVISLKPDADISPPPDVNGMNKDFNEREEGFGNSESIHIKNHREHQQADMNTNEDDHINKLPVAINSKVMELNLPLQTSEQQRDNEVVAGYKSVPRLHSDPKLINESNVEHNIDVITREQENVDLAIQSVKQVINTPPTLTEVEGVLNKAPLMTPQRSVTFSQEHKQNNSVSILLSHDEETSQGQNNDKILVPLTYKDNAEISVVKVGNSVTGLQVPPSPDFHHKARFPFTTNLSFSRPIIHESIILNRENILPNLYNLETSPLERKNQSYYPLSQIGVNNKNYANLNNRNEPPIIPEKQAAFSVAKNYQASASVMRDVKNWDASDFVLRNPNRPSNVNRNINIFNNLKSYTQPNPISRINPSKNFFNNRQNQKQTKSRSDGVTNRVIPRKIEAKGTNKERTPLVRDQGKSKRGVVVSRALLPTAASARGRRNPNRGGGVLSQTLPSVRPPPNFEYIIAGRPLVLYNNIKMSFSHALAHSKRDYSEEERWEKQRFPRRFRKHKF